MRAGALRAVEASWPWTGLGGVSPLEAPRTILNGRISAQRRFAVQTFPISRLRSLAGRGSATINDVFLSLTGGALRSYLEDLGELPTRSLVAQVPISVRAASDESFGNAITYVLLRLGTDIADPVERLRTVSLASAEARRRLSRLSRRAVTAYTTLVAPVMAPTVLGLGGLAPPPANLVVSNVPGPPERLYLNGAAMAHGYGPSVLFHGQALNVTMTSYVDDANISLTGCRVSVPHLQRLALRLGEEVDRLSTVLPA